MEPTQNNMLSALREGECEVTFTKVNGDTRVMRCTLSSGIIPQDKMPKSADTPEMREGLERTLAAIRVYDTGLQEWRSFKTECVQIFAKAVN